ncbi:cytochrome P450 [Saccharothrix syringae]|uniref:Cytochrome P450 n=1 Tax=Saccharothrix syringae TaxID=103733 RepID=A0A5Q0H1K3_SACSY|nr:cytochrome P450 [Saccharothrix syringae]QFZ19562.1 cytochrome P450 [Saccharothrix syringae]
MAEPGSTDGVFDPRHAHRDDPFGFFRDARCTRPVFYSESLRAWCVTRYDDIAAVLRDQDGFSVREHNPRPTATLPPEVEHVVAAWRGDALPLGSLDPPEHARVRAVVRTGFTRRVIGNTEPRARAIARRLLRRLAAGPAFDFAEDFAKPFTLMVVLRVLGIPTSTYQRFDTWTDQRIRIMTAREDTDPEVLRACARGLADYGAFAKRLIAHRLLRPRDDLISALVRDLPVRQAIAQVPTLITAGYRTAAETLTTTVWNQVRAPGGWAAVVDGSVRVDDLVEEGLRYDCPIFGMYRTALRDVEIGGTRVPAGSRVLLAYGSANRDEARFPDPDRFHPGHPTPTPHLAFGLGEHFCVGAPLGRMMLRVALEEMRTALPRLTPADLSEPTYHPTFPFRARQSALKILTTAPEVKA